MAESQDLLTPIPAAGWEGVSRCAQERENAKEKRVEVTDGVPTVRAVPCTGEHVVTQRAFAYLLQAGH